MPNITRTQAVKGSAGALAAALVLAVPVVQKWEGKRNDPYPDVIGVMSVCWGQTGVEMRRYSDGECDAMLSKALRKSGARMQSCLPPDVPVPTLAAFVVFGYNVGDDAACRSTAVQRVWAGDIPGGCDALLWWNKVKNPLTGKFEVSRGLVNRRNDERRLCLEGLS